MSASLAQSIAADALLLARMPRPATAETRPSINLSRARSGQGPPHALARFAILGVASADILDSKVLLFQNARRLIAAERLSSGATGRSAGRSRRADPGWGMDRPYPYLP